MEEVDRFKFQRSIEGIFKFILFFVEFKGKMFNFVGRELFNLRDKRFDFKL